MFTISRCAGCSTAGTVLCRTCRFALVATPRRPHGDVVVAAAYTGRVRDVLLGCKYRNRRAVAAHLGGVIVRSLRREGVDLALVTVVTWAPTGRQRRRQRGFDQAESIARAVAAVLGVPARGLLVRGSDGVGPAVAQTGRGRVERLGAAPRFVAREAAAGAGVLVVDDVVTTGATMAGAAAALRRAGADHVLCAAVAATPPAAARGRRAA